MTQIGNNASLLGSNVYNLGAQIGDNALMEGSNVYGLQTMIGNNASLMGSNVYNLGNVQIGSRDTFQDAQI